MALSMFQKTNLQIGKLLPMKHIYTSYMQTIKLFVR